MLPDRKPTQPLVEEHLMALHSASLRVSGTVHLLYESLQNGRGISPSHADAVCAVIESAQKDLQQIMEATNALVELHLRPPPAA
jgi:hypothetical protein